MKKLQFAFAVSLLVCLTGILLPTAANADFSYSGVYLFRDNRGGDSSSVGSTFGDRLLAGISSVIPSSGTTVTGTDPAGSSHSVPFWYAPTYGPHQYSESFAYDSALAGPWTLSINSTVDGGITVSGIKTPSAAGASLMPFASNLTLLSNGVSWTLPTLTGDTRIDKIQVGIYDREVPQAAAGADLIYYWYLDPTATGYTNNSIQLAADHEYTVFVALLELRDPQQNPYMSNIFSRSRYFINFTTDSAPVPIPGAAWLFGGGLVCLVGLRRKLRG